VEKSLTQAKGRVTVTAKTINSGYRKLATAGTVLQQKRREGSQQHNQLEH
jgi:hypothetical protein